LNSPTAQEFLKFHGLAADGRGEILEWKNAQPAEKIVKAAKRPPYCGVEIDSILHPL